MLYSPSRSLWITLSALSLAALTGLASFLVVSQYPVRAVLSQVPGPIAHSYFGMTVHNYLSTTPWPSIPFASLRTWDNPGLSWADINQAPNTYNWSKLDALIGLAKAHQVDLIFTLGRTPRWASASPDAKSPYGPGQCAPPAKMQYWEEFLRSIVMHANGTIKFWETWNEPQSPDSEFYCGDVATMVELQRRAYEIIKAIDPSSMVLTPSAVGGYGPSWMSRFLAAGGGKYADIMAFHGYLAPRANAESIIDTITKFKAVFTDYGQNGKPVWDTEAGWGENPWLSDPDLQAAFLAKFYLLHWSSGVERLYWYAYDNDEWGTLWDEKHGLHRAGIAYREMHRWLEGATMTAPCSSERGLWTCSLMRENGYRAMVMWSAAADSRPPGQISLPPDFRQYRDLEGSLRNLPFSGALLSDKPILVETATVF